MDFEHECMLWLLGLGALLVLSCILARFLPGRRGYVLPFLLAVALIIQVHAVMMVWDVLTNVLWWAIVVLIVPFCWFAGMIYYLAVQAGRKHRPRFRQHVFVSAASAAFFIGVISSRQ